MPYSLEDVGQGFHARALCANHDAPAPIGCHVLKARKRCHRTSSQRGPGGPADASRSARPWRARHELTNASCVAARPGRGCGASCCCLASARAPAHPRGRQRAAKRCSTRAETSRARERQRAGGGAGGTHTDRATSLRRSRGHEQPPKVGGAVGRAWAWNATLALKGKPRRSVSTSLAVGRVDVRAGWPVRQADPRPRPRRRR